MVSKTKRLGDLAELKFQMLAFEKGFIVSKPFGDNAHYDFIVDFGGILSRVQVRASATLNGKGTGYKLSTCYGNKIKRCYTKKYVDYIAFYLVVEDLWYVIPIEDLGDSKSITIYPNAKKKDAYKKYQNTWGMDQGATIHTGKKSVGKIYDTRYGYAVRFGRKISRHFTNLPDAERCLNDLREKTRLGVL